MKCSNCKSKKIVIVRRRDGNLYTCMVCGHSFDAVTPTVEIKKLSDDADEVLSQQRKEDAEW